MERVLLVEEKRRVNNKKEKGMNQQKQAKEAYEGIKKKDIKKAENKKDQNGGEKEAWGKRMKD